MDLNEFVSKMDSPHETPSGISARCRSHDDTVSSLSINAGDHGGIVVKCHAGCKTADVLKAYGMTIADVMGEPYMVEEYHYQNEDGSPAYVIERWANPKTFRARPGLPPPAQRVLYQFDAIKWVRANNDNPIYVVEGERDVHSLAAKGIPATCNVGGANKWLPHYSEALAGLDVIVVADNDETGIVSARAIVASLREHAKSISLKVSPYGSDVTDLLDAGYTVAALQDLPEAGTAIYMADQIRPRKVAWAWDRYFPLGKLTFVEGDPGDGKSLLTMDLAARFSTGALMPDGTKGMGPVKIALVSAEDDPADTIVPRLVAAGANLNNIMLIPHGIVPELPFELTRDVPWLREACVRDGVQLVVFDPISAFLGERTDTHNDASTRRGLMPLKLLADMTGAAVVGVRHLNKGGMGTKAIYRSSGSIAFVGAARAAFLVAPHPTKPDVRVLACVKASLTRKPPTLTYTIGQTEAGEPYINWGEVTDESAQEILDGPQKENNEDNDELQGKRRARHEERMFLVELLDSDGPMPWLDIVAAGKAEGYSARTLERARTEVMSIESVKLTEDGVTRTLWRRKPTFADGQSTTESEPASPASPLRQPNEQRPVSPGGGEVAKLALVPDAELLPDGTTEDDRDDQLAALPLVCGVCGSAEGRRFGKPWWVVRCLPHNPRTYGRI